MEYSRYSTMHIMNFGTWNGVFSSSILYSEYFPGKEKAVKVERNKLFKL